MNDGMKYGGDFGTVSNVKLNNQVDVKGEATTEADLTTGNIGVVSSQAGDNGLLTVKLNKDINLGSTGSLTFGSGDNTVSISNSGLNNGGNKITNVATGTDGTDAVNVDQLTKAIAGVSSGEGSKTNLTVEGGTAAGTGGNYAGSNLQVTEKTETTGATTYDVKLADNITLGSEADSAAGTEGTDGSITVNGKDGSAVAINGADGSIALNTADGSPVTIQAGTSANNLAGNPVDRITVGGQTVATMSDGLKFAGDDGQSDTTKVIPKTLNEQLDIVGGAEGELTDKNIGVNNVNGQLKVQLVKDVDLGSTGSLTLGNTVVNNNGITITPATGDPVSLTGSGLDNGNNVISNVATGVKGTDAVNVDQLTKAIAGVSAGEGSKTNLTVEGGTAAGTGGNYAGSNLQITEKNETTGATTYDVKLADNITLGSAADSAAGTEGTDSSITVNGKDGSAVAINGADGSIALNTTDGSPVTIKGGTAANDVNGKSIDRVTVGGATVATLDDGMVYTGDTGSAAVKLNKTVNIVGGETDSSKLSTDNNIGIVAEQDGDNGKLTVRLAKDITGLNTVTAGDATIGTQTETTANGVAQTGSYVTGLDNTEWNVADPDIVTGRAATEDQLKTVSDAVTNAIDGTSENATGGFGLADGSGTTVKQDLGKTITVKGGVTDGTATTDNPTGTSNITTAVKDGALEVSLNKDLDLGSTGSVTTGNTVVNNDGVKVGDTALTSGGLTITNGPSVTTGGIDGGSKQITNVASGSDGVDDDGNPTYNNLTNGANIGDIKNITDAAKTELTNDGLNFTADSGDSVHRNLGETLNIAGDGNITTTSDADNGKITVGLSNTIALGEKASEDGTTEGIDGSITVNGKDGSAVAINGADGSIALNTGSDSPITIQAGSSVNDVTGTPVNRITVGGQTVATMNDGMKYGGDFGTVSNVKLNNQVDVKGEATTEANLTSGNIGVVSSQAGDNGLLVVKLNKDIDLGEKGSVTTGNTVVNNSGLTITNGPSVTTGGIDAGGSKITNVATGTDGTDAVNVAQLEKRISDIAIGESKTTELTVEGGKAAPTDGTYAGSNLQVTASTTANGSPTYDVKLADNITLGSATDSESGTTGTDGSITLNGANGSSVAVNGADGSVTAKGTDGSAVVINGADGSIGLTGPAGEDGTQTTVTIAAGNSVNNVDGTPVDRITAGGQTIATMSDGQKYAGDNAKEDGTNVIAKKLNEQLDIVGGADADKLTENNIGVNNVNGQLKVQLAQNIDLGKDGSVTMGNTVVNNSGLTIANGPSVTSSGINAGESKITNVADGDVSATSTDAVNGSQLKAVQDIAEKHTKVTVEGGTEAGTTDYAGNNLQLKATTVDGQTTYDLKLADNLSIGTKGADGKDGVDGSIGVNGKDGSSVVINGTDGISVKGADGKDGVTITGKDGVDGVDGAEGHIGLNGKDGMTDIYTTPGQPGVNGQDGDTMTRIIYTDPNEANHEVATLDDGMKYTGDTGSAAVALNKTVNIVGGETDSTKLSTDNNIGIVAEQADDNAKLTVRLAKDITGLNTVTAGEATIGNQSILTAGGVEQDGSYVTGLDNTSWNVTNPDIVSGRAATEDQLKIVTDTVNALADGTSENATGGFGLTDDSGTAVKQDIGKTIQIAGDGNITTTADATSGKLTVGLSNTIALGEKASEDGTTEGADSSITVNGKDGSSVAINGADGTIALNTADGSPVTIAAGTQVNNLAGTPIDRITIGSATVATLDDGMKYYGDFGDVASVKLNNQVNVKGEANSKDDLTTGNIGVVSAQDGDNALLTVKLNKDINLGSTGSVTTGNTVINNSGVTITPTGGNPVTLTDAGLNNGDNKITNVAPGAINEDSMDAVNGSQLNEIRKLAGQHTYVTVEGGTEGEAAEYAGKNLLLQTRRDNNLTTYYDLKLSDNITLGSANDSEGTGGVDSSITLNGAAGSSVAINGGDGSIALTGANGSTATIAAGTSTPNLAGTAIDRITAGGSTVATLDDGMKYGGDFGDTSKVKLNNQVNVKGNAKNEADLTDGNIGVVSIQDGDNGQLLIKLNKDLNLGDTGSVTMGNTVINNSGVTIGSGTSAVTLTDKGLNNGGNQITNVASGTTGKTYDTSVDGQENYNNAANIGDLTTAINDVKNADNGGGFGLTADDGKSVKQDLGSTITVTGDNNIETKVTDDGKLQVGLKDNVDLGQNGSITAGNTTIDKGGVSTDKIAIKDSGISIDKDGINAGNKQIKDVGSGLGNTYDTSVAGQENYNNGANIGDVYNIAKGQADAVKAQSGKNITVGDDNKVNLNDNITLGDTTDPSKQVNIDGNGATVTAGSGDNQVKLDGSKGQISAGGAVLGNQENTANDGNPATGNYLTGLDNTKWDSNNIQSGRAATEDQLKVVDDKVNKGRVFQGDDGADNSVTVGLGDTLKLNGGADTSKLSSGNIGVVRNSSGDGLDIKLAKDLKDLDSVTTGNTTINDSGVTIKTVDSDRTITIQDSNVNMGNNVVSGVADGTVAPGSTEAINGGQLALRDQAINSLGGEVNKLDNRINRVGAGAAALAALHPQDFDPDDKWDFAFGYGHYRGANAGAFGAFYKPNEDTTFSVGGTIGGGENMINAGVSFKLGQGNNVSNSRVGMAKEIKHLRDDVAKLEDIVNRQSQMINQLTGQNPGTIESKGSELFPDVPANHWAYEYVTKLHQLGIIEGYPDGNFDGNRMMTRYEFAAVVYRAIMAGAASNAALQGDDTLDRLANEFSAELKYIRIDTIAKDKDGKPTIQRVRIVPENKQN
ncbi:S-layer homology domain-containing protein [Megasphaera massiliensis]|uniref:S-layer homology domain-containing protein n=4 Tax=Megasphaera TaxID=906 RepID=UPI003AF81535